MFSNRRAVRRILSPVENSAVHLGMQRLHAPVEHLGEAGNLGDIFDRDPRIAQQLGCAAGRDQFDPHAGKFAGEISQARFVGNAQNGTLDFLRHLKPRVLHDTNTPGVRSDWLDWKCQQKILSARDALCGGLASKWRIEFL